MIKKIFFSKKTKKTNLKFLNIRKERNYSKCKLTEVHTILLNRYKIYRYMLFSLFLFLHEFDDSIRCYDKNTIFFFTFSR